VAGDGGRTATRAHGILDQAVEGWRWLSANLFLQQALGWVRRRSLFDGTRCSG
jgi:hypothetical protein